MTDQPMPSPVAEVFTRFPEPVRARLLEVRDLIFTVADETEGVGPLTETLKWGEPAYLTEKSGSGTTIRLGISKAAPEDCAVFVNCQTTLIATFRAHFADDFAFEGQRALIVPADSSLSREPLALCLRAALTYHRQKPAAKIRSA
ncbi:MULTISPECIES: DUF1801 domain-containing protein [unclassified Rhizobium]|uniref:DUF1801 domain-containing protein n=1 Tax=unclassified Rhizobium TaxID=2613769 RepID=UPI00071462C6|nr:MULTISPECIES: DUF1801 domain-containing protein [unclassified Rhizobium]KQS87606.1 hypothetical protein ASG42_19485 [Rhizobium sp. Leaf391]KQT07042.1 hypothetical protein ASG50_01030 [Rhizobium sp. Leaf386]KQT95168.1 hypothetical protein ASG68_14295 [Rhizobium sp. Leaf453]